MKRKRLWMPGVILLLAVALAAWAGEAKTDRHSFSVNSEFGDRDVFTFEVNTTGTIRIEARWSGSTPLALILNGPGQTGYYQRKDGSSPLVVIQDVTPEILARGTQWQASIVNFSRSGGAFGQVAIEYPVMPAFNPRYTQFDRLSIVSVEKFPGRALITADYTLSTPHSRDVFMGAHVLVGDENSRYFGYRPARLHPGSGQVQVEVLYGVGSAPASVWTDKISIMMYEGGQKPFCTLIQDLRLQWQR